MLKLFPWLIYRFGRKNVLFTAIFVVTVAVVAGITWKMIFSGSASENNAKNTIAGSTLSDKFDGYIVEFKQDPLSAVTAKKLADKQLLMTQTAMSEADARKQIATIYSDADTLKQLAQQKVKINQERDSFYVSLENLRINIAKDDKHKSNGRPYIASNWTGIINAVLIKGISENDIQIITQQIAVVKNVSKNYQVKATLMDSVPLIGADQVWNNIKDQNNAPVTGTGIRVGVIDSGIDYTNPDFGSCTSSQFLNNQCAKLAGGYDFVNYDNNPMDDYGHGTHVAGIVASSGNLKGVSPGSTLYAYKVLDSSGSGYESSVINGISMSLDPNSDGNYSDHLDVINLSLGSPYGSPDDAVSQAINHAADSDIVAVVTAGNNGPDAKSIGSPGTARGAITVGATFKMNYTGNYFGDLNPKVDQVTIFSSRGPVIWGTNYLIKPDVVAPGALICASRMGNWSPGGFYVPCLDSRHLLLAGTSMAAPHVTGVAALIKQKHPDWSSTEIKMAIRDSAVNLNDPSTGLPYDINTQGYGRVNALAAVQIGSAPPVSIISSSGKVSGSKDIQGTATSRGTTNYKLYYANKSDLNNWSLIANVDHAVTSGTLATWDTRNSPDGEYRLKLVVTSNSVISQDQSIFFIGNHVITYPVDLIRDNFSHYEIFPKWNNIPIKGTSVGSQFNHYTISWCKADNCSQQRTDGVTLSHNGQTQLTNSELGKWNPSGISNVNTGYYRITMTTYNNDGSNVVTSIQLYLDAELAVGWPKNTIGGPDDMPHGQPTIADINKDGKQEIIVTSNDQIMVYDYQGNVLPGWPWKINEHQSGSYISSPAAIGDIDGDGNLEMVIQDSLGYVYALSQSGTIKSPWPKLIGSEAYYGSRSYGNEIILADINNDGKKEIIFIRDADTKVFAVDSSGQPLSGWPKDLAATSPYTQTFLHSLSVSDVSHDGYYEIALSSTAWYHDASGGHYKNNIWLLDHNGTAMNGWPIVLDTGWMNSSVILADVDGDGTGEIVYSAFPSVENSSQQSYIYAVKPDKTNLTGWPFLPKSGEINTGNLVAASLDGGPQLSIIFESYTLYYVINSNGTVRSQTNTNCIFRADLKLGWPKCYNLSMWGLSATVANIDSDDVPEIILPSSNYEGFFQGEVLGLLLAFKTNGATVPGFPKRISSVSRTWDVATVSDLNNDGKNELIYNDYDHVYIWNTNARANTTQWGQNGHDASHTNAYPDIVNIFIDSQPKSASVQAGQAASFSVTVSGGTAPYHYQWQKKGPKSNPVADIPGATSSTYTINSASLTDNGTSYRVVVTDASGRSVTSDFATLSVILGPPDKVNP